MDVMETKLNMKDTCTDDASFLNNSSMVQNKKVIKHALRQQVKRRKKNTIIAAGNLRLLPKISQVPSSVSSVVTMSADPPLSGFNDQQNPLVSPEAVATMKEVLASLPGFSFKSNRRRSSKKLSTAAQLEAGLVDLESPASILSNVSLKVLLNRHSFQGLPPLYQRKLAQLLPMVDRQEAANVGLNNEFFARACQEWRKRLAEGEFTPENQQRLRLEAEKDKNKLDPWKLKHFEPIWGEKRDAQKIKSTYNCFARDQKYQKNLFRSDADFPLQSHEDIIIENQQSFSVSLDNKIEQNLLSVLDDVSNKTPAISVKDGRDLSEFDVTINISEEDEEDDDRDADEDGIGDDECDEDDESDENYEEEYEDEFYEEDDIEDEEFANRVTLTYLDEEAQHCGEMVVVQDSDEEPYSQKLNLQNSFKDISSDQEDIPVDTMNANNVGKMDTTIKDMISTTVENDNKNYKSSIRDFQSLNNTILRNKSQSESFLVHNTNKSSKPPDKCFSYQMKIQTYEQSLQRFKTDDKAENDCRSTVACTKSSKNDENFGSQPIHQECNNTMDEHIINQTVEETGVIELDQDSLQQIHGLENQGGLPDTYEEISACSEEVISPILDEIGINADIKISEAAAMSEVVICQRTNENIDTNIQEEAFQEANSYVCSEMLDCHWESHSRIDVGTSSKDGELPWSSVSSDIDSSASTNLPVAFKNKLQEAQILSGQKYPRTIAKTDDLENIVDTPSYIQLPFNQMQSDSLKIGAPISACMMKNFSNTQNSSFLSFPQIQSIRFVQTNFQTTLEHNSSESINSVPTECSQVQESFEDDNNSVCNNETHDDDNVLKHIQSIPSENPMNAKNSLTHNTVVFQQQSLHPLSSRQLITTLQHHQSNVPLIMNVSSRNNRTGVQSGHRFSRIGNRDQNSSRSRNMTKEPPGAVNLERSYQICQAVIASSPNRDQLKAHLKPPPSLLSKSEKSSIELKPNNRIETINKRKFPQSNTTTTAYSKKIGVSPVKRLFKNSSLCEGIKIKKKNNTQSITILENFEESECYKFSKKYEEDLAPRASSAPPIPPPIIAVNLFKGRPASADERSHEAISLKSNNEIYFVNEGSEPSTPDMIMACQPPSPCECNIQEAMVVCRQCGAFCHHDCISLQSVCASCLMS